MSRLVERKTHCRLLSDSRFLGMCYAPLDWMVERYLWCQLYKNGQYFERPGCVQTHFQELQTYLQRSIMHFVTVLLVFLIPTMYATLSPSLSIPHKVGQCSWHLHSIHASNNCKCHHPELDSVIEGTRQCCINVKLIHEMAGAASHLEYSDGFGDIHMGDLS